MEDPFKEENITDMLVRFLRKSDISWSQYQRFNEEVTRELSRNGFIVDERGIETLIPDIRRLGHYVKTILNSDIPRQIVLVSDDLFPDFNYQKLSKKGNLFHANRRSRETVIDNFLEKIKQVQTRDLFVGMDEQGNVLTEKRDKKGKVRRSHLNNVQREISFWKLLGYNNFCWEQEVSKGRRR